MSMLQQILDQVCLLLLLYFGTFSFHRLRSETSENFSKNDFKAKAE